jgi:hypothetical protein
MRAEDVQGVGSSLDGKSENMKNFKIGSAQCLRCVLLRGRV